MVTKDKKEDDRPILEESIEVSLDESGAEKIRIKGAGAALAGQKESLTRMESESDMSNDFMKVTSAVALAASAAHPPILVFPMLVAGVKMANAAYDISNNKEKSIKELPVGVVDETSATMVPDIISGAATEAVEHVVPGAAKVVQATLDVAGDTLVEKFKEKQTNAALQGGRDVLSRNRAIVGDATEALSKEDGSNNKSLKPSNFRH